MTNTVLHLDASARYDASFSRKVSQQIVDKLGADEVIYRDLAKGVPLINEDWVVARFTPADQWNDAQKEVMKISDELIAEIQAADTIVIGSPVYNFNISAALKLWLDQIIRPGATVLYDAEGNSKGTLEGKKVYVAIASAGVAEDTPVDFISGYLKFVFGFLGITDVNLIWADRAMFRGDEVFAAIDQEIDKVLG